MTMIVLAIVGLVIAAIILVPRLLHFPLSMFDVDAVISDAATEPGDLPDQRSFSMGFVYQPYAWNDAAFTETADLIFKHGDHITIFHDVGIPWEEALTGNPYPADLEKQIERELAVTKRFSDTGFVVSFLGSDRRHLSQNLGPSGTENRSGDWATRDFNHPEVNKAFLNYCRDMIERFQPRGLCYLAEVDSAMTDVNDPDFKKVLAMSQVVYSTLKTEHPDIKVFAEFNLGDEAYMDKRRDVIEAMLPWTDLFALSVYPASYDSIGGNGAKVTDEWFDLAKEISGDKPIAILETAFPAEPSMHPTLGIRIQGESKRLLIPGGPKSQALYIKTLLESANRLDMEFVNLWTVRDMDELFDTLANGQNEFADPLWRLVQDTGLYDEIGKPRRSLDVWEAWRNVKRNE
ncbi:MAG: hypothetical protein H6821_09115 [Planctomycetaceae bacterium]|nr:hypothetical protein [Planctomycetales bacterium]MCB9874323.1 hypothetical protein [Planctomycetaceae bacterium]MCB9941534.1 hypothetical protein [Planctomycetaceae bacterium]